MLETIHPAQVLTTRQQGQGKESFISHGLFAFGDMPWEVGEPKWGYGGRSGGCVINEFTSAPGMLLRRARREARSLVVPNKGRATQPCAKAGPALRVVPERAPCCVAGLAKGATISCGLRLAWHALRHNALANSLMTHPRTH